MENMNDGGYEDEHHDYSLKRAKAGMFTRLIKRRVPAEAKWVTGIDLMDMRDDLRNINYYEEIDQTWDTDVGDLKVNSVILEVECLSPSGRKSGFSGRMVVYGDSDVIKEIIDVYRDEDEHSDGNIKHDFPRFDASCRKWLLDLGWPGNVVRDLTLTLEDWANPNQEVYITMRSFEMPKYVLPLYDIVIAAIEETNDGIG